MLKHGIAVALFLAWGCGPASAESHVLRVGGTGAATELLRQLGDTFGKRSGERVEVTASLGTTGGLRALADDQLDLVVAGRELKPDEHAKGLQVADVLRTPFVLVTSHKNPNAISTADVARAYLDPDMAWRDGTPVRVILRPRSESDVALMVSMFPDLGTAMEAARKRPEVPTAATDQDTAEAAERIEGSLVGLSLTQLLLEKRDLRVVPINGRVPTPQSIQSGDYPYIKTLYLLTRTNPDKLVSAFIEFVNSDDCQAYLRNAFVWPVGTR